MPEGDSPDDGETDGHSADQRIYHRTVEPETERANERLLRLIADLEGCEMTDLPPLYNRIDDLLTDIFDSPPPAEAQAELEFSYYGYRITIDQAGEVSLMKLPEGSPTEVDEE
jgi:hypothetical protein